MLCRRLTHLVVDDASVRCAARQHTLHLNSFSRLLAIAIIPNYQSLVIS
ncbi:hypothetical protein FDUTEX481_03628 [Tolypothrix sp. PCC 7601]|nr:hypothetical protein FDUTEX481_03628 [Tolypothrix sp. PCC 7601]